MMLLLIAYLQPFPGCYVDFADTHAGAIYIKALQSFGGPIEFMD